MQVHPILLRLTLIISLFLLAAIEARAQRDFVRAHVRSVTGIARIYVSPQSGGAALKQNAPIEPGNKIETDRNSRVVISLTDGGQITVLPNSKVVLKNFLVAHSARELLDIVVGRVLVKIRSVGGKPNPYRLNSPAASIAVRGTEFIVDVLMGGETLVLVKEGLVEVWPHNNPGNKRLVTPGGRVTVRPGGDISSIFPAPRLSGNSLTQNSSGVSPNSSDVSPIFFSAFPDQHLDSLDNPAYAAEFKNAEGRLLLLPSVSNPYRSPVGGPSNSKDPPPLDYSVFPQLTFYTPIPGSRLVIGGGVSALRDKLQELIDFQYKPQDLIDSQYPDSELEYSTYDHQVTRLNVFNLSLIAAYSFGDHGRTSVGIGVDRLSGGENFSSRYRNIYRNEANKYSSPYRFSDELDDLNARFAHTRLTIGLARRFSESMKIGVYYRQGFNSSDQENQYRREYEYQYRVQPTSASYFASGKVNMSTFSSSSELGIRFRASLTRRFFYGIEGSYLYERINSRRETLNQPIAYNSYLARRARLGGGLGFALTSKILLNFDIASGLFNNSQPAEKPLNLSGNFSFAGKYHSSLLPRFTSTLFSSPGSVRGRSVSAHAAVQTNPWRNFLLSFSNLTTLRIDSSIYNGGYTYKHARYLYNVGLGWKFRPNLTAEYLLSIDNEEQVPSHSLRLRYTFNLGVTNEK